MVEFLDCFEAPDGQVLRRGDSFRVAGRRGVFTFQTLVLEPRGKIYVMAHGPLTGGAEGGGQCFYVGNPTTRKSPITGKREQLLPVRIVPLHQSKKKPRKRRIP